MKDHLFQYCTKIPKLYENNVLISSKDVPENFLIFQYLPMKLVTKVIENNYHMSHKYCPLANNLK